MSLSGGISLLVVNGEARVVQRSSEKLRDYYGVFIEVRR